MIFEALPARFGDCLLLQVPSSDGPLLMVIDGGPGTVFKDILAPRLAQMSRPGETLAIEAVMVSHVDADHITGVLSLLSAIQKAKIGNQQPPYRVSSLLFNSFDRIAEAKPADVAGAKGVLASLSGSQILLGEHATQEVLASVAQGGQLSTLAKGLNIPLNPSTDGELLCVDGEPHVFKFGAAEVMIVGPRLPEINALRKEWARWRAKQNKKTLKALAAYADESVPNLSSIVALVTYKTKAKRKRRVLLTGDARGDYVMNGLEAAGVLPKGGVLAEPLDVLKLPHHGSARNIDRDFFERLPARHIVASGDGWYGNPDRETLEMLEAARPAGDYALHLTYDAAHMDAETTKYLAQQTKPKIFDPATQSTGPVLARLTQAGVTITYGAVKIDLGA